LIADAYRDYHSEKQPCTFAIHLTKYPAKDINNDHTNTLKLPGLTDEEFWILLVTAYFNFEQDFVLAITWR
jgi:hypothetical protein